MKQKILIFIFNGYADWEIAYVAAELNKTDTYCIETVSMGSELITSMGGLQIQPDYTIDDYPAEFRMLILAGGDAWLEEKNEKVKAVVDYAIKKDIPVAAICNAVNFMAEHGYLDQISHTGNPLWYLKKHAPTYKGEGNYLEKQAVCDQGIITANGSAALEFTGAILELLNAGAADERKEWYQLHKTGFYPRREVALGSVMLDCDDPLVLATFYANLLGGEVTQMPFTDEWAQVTVEGTAITICCQREEFYRRPVWPATGAKEQQMMAHLDFVTEDQEKAVAYALELGADVPSQQLCPEGWTRPWVTLLDPAGHPFCLTAAKR